MKFNFYFEKYAKINFKTKRLPLNTTRKDKDYYQPNHKYGGKDLKPSQLIVYYKFFVKNLNDGTNSLMTR